MLDLFVNLRNPAVYPAGCYYIIDEITTLGANTLKGDLRYQISTLLEFEKATLLPFRKTILPYSTNYLTRSVWLLV